MMDGLYVIYGAVIIIAIVTYQSVRLYRRRIPRAEGRCPASLQTRSIRIVFVLLYIILHVLLTAFHIYSNKSIHQVPGVVANRIGCLALANIPILIFLAMRNSVLNFAGFSYLDLRFYHIVIGWGVGFMTLLHAAIWTWQLKYNGSYANEWSEQYFIFGVVASFALAIIFGLTLLRKRQFEAFYITHVVFSAVFLAGVFYHWQPLSVWVYVAAGIWIFERLVRMIRLRLVTARVTLQDDAVLLDVDARCGPGQHFYVTFLSVRCWESHPFTPIRERSLRFIVRQQQGVTRSLYENLKESGVSSTRLWLQGPYDSNSDVSGNTWLFAAGSGISHIMSLLPINGNVSLFWVVKRTEQLKWLEGFEDLLAETNVRIFVTTVGKNDLPLEGELFQHVTYQRPDMSLLIHEAIRKVEAPPSNVICCGPFRFNEQVARSIKSLDVSPHLHVINQ